jgi:hypothetical protein
MILWLVYNAVIPLFPIALVWFISWFLSQPKSTPPSLGASVFSIIKDGQVFFFCTALASAAVGDLGKAQKGFESANWIAGLVCVIIIATAAFAGAALNKDAVDQRKVGWSSILAATTTTLLVLISRHKAGLL